MKNRRLVIELLGLHKDKAYGFQQYILNLLDYLYQHRDDIHYDLIILVCKDSERELLARYEEKFDVMTYHVSRFSQRLWLQTCLPFKLRLTNDDLLLSPGNTSGLVKRCPEILVIHDLLFKRRELCNFFVRCYRRLYVPISIKKADKIVAISNFTKADVEHYYPIAKGKTEVIYNPIQSWKFDVNETSVINRNYFLAISTSSDYKNQKTIFRSYKAYCEKGGEKHLVIIGIINPKSDAYKEYMGLPSVVRERIIWKGNLSNAELVHLYRHASCYISASKFEGFGMPVAEAMSFGLPVLLSDIPPHREVSQNKGEFFSPTDVNSLASKMLNMTFDRRDDAKDIQTAYADDKTSAIYVDLINRMCHCS